MKTPDERVKRRLKSISNIRNSLKVQVKELEQMGIDAHQDALEIYRLLDQISNQISRKCN